MPGSMFLSTPREILYHEAVLTVDSIIQQLDVVEGDNPPISLGAHAFDLLDRFATSPERLQFLIERYGASPCLELVANLALVLARRGDNATVETANLLPRFIEKIDGVENPHVLQACLEALKLHLIHDCFWSVTPEANRAIASLLSRCLQYSASRNYGLFVRQVAVQVISLLFEKELLMRTFSAHQIRWLRKTLQRISQEEVTIQEELLGLREFVWDPEWRNQERR